MCRCLSRASSLTSPALLALTSQLAAARLLSTGGNALVTGVGGSNGCSRVQGRSADGKHDECNKSNGLLVLWQLLDQRWEAACLHMTH